MDILICIGVFLISFIGVFLIPEYIEHRSDVRLRKKFNMPLRSFSQNIKLDLQGKWIQKLVVLSMLPATVITILYILIFYVVPEHNRCQNIKTELIEKHRIEKCPDCIWQNWGQMRYNPDIKQYEYIPGTFTWSSCKKLEKELEEKLKQK